MKVALIGASGNVGARIVGELSARDHRVTAIARNPEKVASLPGVEPVRGDVARPEELAAILKGHDAIISSVRFTEFDPVVLLEAIRASGVRRYLVVGGAGSLFVSPGVELNDTPDFPQKAQFNSRKGGEYLKILKRQEDLDWTFLSPSQKIFDGERTGKFRLGKDALLVGPDGSRISYQDYAVALVDELEQPRHVRERFTVGY